MNINSSYSMEFISKHRVSKIKLISLIHGLLWQFMANTKWRRLSLTFYRRGVTVVPITVTLHSSTLYDDDDNEWCS